MDTYDENSSHEEETQTQQCEDSHIKIFLTNSIKDTLSNVINNKSYQAQNFIDYLAILLKLRIISMLEKTISNLPLSTAFKIAIHDITDVIVNSAKEYVKKIIQGIEYRFSRNLTEEIDNIKNDFKNFVFNFFREKIFGLDNEDCNKHENYESKLLNICIYREDDAFETSSTIPYSGQNISSFE